MTEQSTPSGLFTEDHRHCDNLWSAVEAAVDTGDAAKAKQAFDDFAAALRRHLRMEEEVLFPAIENATGMQGGPTFVMRSEHEQMRGVLDQMQALLDGGDPDGVLDHGDTLLMLIQQHNAKEEGILYPMADQTLGERWPELRARLEQI